MLEFSWFVNHLDYLGFILEVQPLLGGGAMRAMAFSGDTVETFKEILGVGDLKKSPLNENQGFGQSGVDLLRVVNKYKLNADAKWQAVGLVKSMCDLLDDGQLSFRISKIATQSLQQLTCLNSFFKKDFGYHFSI